MAMPEAVTNVLRPSSLAIILIALDERVLNAVPSWPSVTSLITPSVTLATLNPPFWPVMVVEPWLRYAAIANPDAIPVTLGCGIDFLIFLPGLFLRTYARRAVLRMPPFLVDRLAPFERR